MFESKNKGLFFIFITLLIDVIGFGIIIPVLPKLIAELVRSDLSEAAIWGGILMGTFAVMQFLFAPIIGGLSDQFGRRPVLLASLFAFGLDYILLGFAPNIGWLFIGRMFAGITGASFSTATAYISDISEPEKKAQNFGLIGAAFGLGFILGPVLGGVLGSFGSRVPFFAAAFLSFVNWLYGYFILPESLKPENRRAFDIKRANPFGGILRLKKYPKIIGLVWALFIIYIAGHANQSSWVYITMEKFNWDEKMVGLSLGWVGLMVAIVQGGLSRIIIPKLGQNQSVYIGLAISSLGFVLFAFATQTWMMFAFMTIFAFGGIAGPSLQSLISNQVAANEQGEVQGTLASIVSLTSIIGPLLMNNVLFHYFSKKTTYYYFPGAPFLLGAVLTLISALIAYRSYSTRDD
ncbi:MAG: TCR/Tet family MFS transporter [Saprospiraceae bacterium]